MKSLTSKQMMLAACEPDLAKLPVTLTVRTDAGIRSGGLWVIGALFVAAPICIIWFMLSSIIAGELPITVSWDAAWIWGTLALMFFSLFFGTRECYALWQSGSWTRTMTFGEDAIAIVENGVSGARHWNEHYSAYVGIVLHVMQGELPSHSQQLISLRHNDAERNILLHKSQGNGLDPAIQNRAQLWAAQLNVPVFVENETGNLILLNLPH